MAAEPAAPDRSRTHALILPATLLAVLLLDAATVVVVVSYGQPYLLRVLKAPESYPAFGFGLYGIAKLAGSIAGGRLVDRAGLRRSTTCSALLQTSGILTVVVSGSAIGYLVGAAVVSLGTALAWVLIFSAVGEASHSETRTRATSFMALASASGVASGFAVGVLGTLGGPRWWPFVLALAAFLGTNTLLATTGRSRRDTRIPSRERASEAAHREPPMWDVRALAALHFAFVGGLLGLFGPLLLSHLNLSTVAAASTLAPAALAALVSMLLTSRLGAPRRQRATMSVLYGVTGFALVTLLLRIEAVWVGVWLVPLAAAIAALNPLLNARLIDAAAATARPSVAMGTLLFAEGLGSALGPLAVGFVIQQVGLRAGIWVLAATAGLLVTAGLRRRSLAPA